MMTAFQPLASQRETHRRILAIALPAICANLTAVLPGLVDTAFIGRTADAGSIGGIAIGTNLCGFVLWAFSFLRMGTAGFTAQAFGATATVDYHHGYPVTINAAAQTEFCAAVARQVAGPEHVDTNTPAIMGAEDFAYMLEERPGAFIFTGNGNTKPVHHPGYDFNDAAIPFGSSYWVRLVETAMPAA